MKVHVLKYGNLTGSPDIKAMQLASGVGLAKTHTLFEDLFSIKLSWGLTGQSTSLLLEHPLAPDFFPAVVDLSYISPDPKSHAPESIQAALDRLLDFGIRPQQIKSYMVTHTHGDHFDRRLMDHFPQATLVKPTKSDISKDLKDYILGLSKWIEPVTTPGHGSLHQSFIFDQNELDCSVCIAGDLIMSHAHFLDLGHPLSFTNPEQGKKSIAKIFSNLASRKTRYKLIVPGHDIPFFANPYQLKT